MDFGAVMVATCLSAAIATLIMGFAANYPIALAPGMGENFFFVYTVVLTMGLAWPEAMAAVFYAGLIFLLLTVLGIREALLNLIPESLKLAMGIGIGIFITFIGFSYAGVIVKNPGALVQLGDVTAKPVWLSLTGVLVTAALIVRRIPGAVLWGILLTGAGALALGLTEFQGVVSTPPSLAPTLAKLDFTPSVTSSFLSAVFVFLFMDMFDTIGTLIGVSERGGFLKDGKLPRAGRAMMADSGGTVVGAVLGTSTITSYIESTTGIEQGARTGLANVITAGGFVLALFFSPLVRMIGGGVEVAEGLVLKPVIAPALIVVGAFMTSMVRRISWDDFSESLPAFLIIVGIPLTFSISDGLAFGFVTYPIIKLLSGRAKSVHPAMYVIGILFIIRYVVFPN